MNKYSSEVNKEGYGIVGILKQNNRTTKYAIGNASPNEKMTTDKIFNLGSFTKMFTAVLIMQEIEKGTLKLNDKIAKFFPKSQIENQFVDSDITIEQLLYHRSGLGEVISDLTMNEAYLKPYFDYNFTNLYLKIPKSKSDKDTKSEYCNTNYILLGYILESINNKPYYEILENRIFKELKLNNTYSYFSNSIPNIAHPYVI